MEDQLSVRMSWELDSGKRAWNSSDFDNAYLTGFPRSPCKMKITCLSVGSGTLFLSLSWGFILINIHMSI